MLVSASLICLMGTLAPPEYPIERVLERNRRISPQQRQAIAVAVLESARAHRLDPALILAVIDVESSFRLSSRSSVGAMGLMQLMPKTGRQFARRLGLRWHGEKTLYTPAENVRIGAAYLSWLLRRFNGDLQLALSSYCHGPMTVRRALDQQGALSAYRARYAGKVKRALTRVQRTLWAAKRNPPEPGSRPRYSVLSRGTQRPSDG